MFAPSVEKAVAQNETDPTTPGEVTTAPAETTAVPTATDGGKIFSYIKVVNIVNCCSIFV